MKILRILPVAAIACLAVSCQNGNGSQLSENATPTDSLMFYLGKMNAADYLRDAERDTTLKSNSEKMVYLNGVKAGLAALKDGNETFNKGYMLGVNMASQMIAFAEQMDVKINRDSYINSLSAAIEADTMPNLNEIQISFRQVMQNIEMAKDEKDRIKSKESLKKEAATAGLPEIRDDLYGKVTNATNGEALKAGDEITLQAKVTKLNGDFLNLPLPDKGVIGNQRFFPEILSEAISKLKSGETGEFMTTSHAVFGSRGRQFNLEPTDVIKFYLTPTLVPKTEDENKDEAAAPAAGAVVPGQHPAGKVTVKR